MIIELNETHDPNRKSWVESANAPATDFPIQNLPFGVYSLDGEPRGGVALGDRIIDLSSLAASQALGPVATRVARAASGSSLLPLLNMPREEVSTLRKEISALFSQDNRKDEKTLVPCLVNRSDTKTHMPLKPTAFTDFCASIDHIRRMSGGNALQPAWSYIPIAYNGRASSVFPDGTPVTVPHGIFAMPPRSDSITSGPEPMLDFELEFGVWLSGGNSLGQPITVAEAEDMLFGCCLVNDWSARAIQFFESMLGPHLGKSFLTSVSPWIVTMEALAPFRVAARGREQDETEIPAYLLDAQDREQGGLNITLTADYEIESGQEKQVVNTEFRDMFWTLAQMVAHQASTGAPLEAGDLVGSGTVSGPGGQAKACLVEITGFGQSAVVFENGEHRSMLNAGDRITLKGRAHADGFVSIGFGECSGTVYSRPGGNNAKS